MIEDEIIHWWKDEAGESHRNCLRVESDPPQLNTGFPRDGVVSVRLINTVSNQCIKLSLDLIFLCYFVARSFRSVINKF